jgi:pimeloyl-ACP methyl ester carboxylesterase
MIRPSTVLSAAAAAILMLAMPAILAMPAAPVVLQAPPAGLQAQTPTPAQTPGQSPTPSRSPAQSPTPPQRPAKGKSQKPAAPAPAEPQSESPHRDATFRVFFGGRPVGSQTVLVDVSDTEWRVRCTGQLTPPLAHVLRGADIRYDRQWHPLGYTLDATVKDQAVRITTTFANGKAESQIIRGDESTPKSDAVSETTIVLPNNIYGAYEAVVARLGGAPQPGLSLPVYVAPQVETRLTLESSVAERVSTGGRSFQSRHYVLSAMNPNGPIKIEVWADDRGHLMRIRIPSVTLEVTREDIATVATREETSFRANDEDISIPANGFNLAGTVSKPAAAAPDSRTRLGSGKEPDSGKGADSAKGPMPKGVNVKPVRLPAIVLVGGSGPTDRNENVFGIPIFQQLANPLADAGYVVVRYDKRGVAQSGGRPESATLADYAEDLRAAVRYLTNRKDVDEDRIAVIGHSEGAAVSMLAAKDEKKIHALVLIAGIGTTGADLILEQQRYMLSRTKLSDQEKQAKIDLQKKIQAAAVSGQGWEGIPADLRRAADTPWFRSVLQFDAAQVMKDVRQPILIVQGELDTQVPPQNADRLAELARSRKKAADVQEVKLPGVNHLLVVAKTGDVDEYASLAPKTISPDVATKIIDWLKSSLAPKK